MSIDISDGIESGNLTIKVLTTNTSISTLLTDEKFEGKIIQPHTNGSKYLAEHGLAMSIEIKQGEEIKKYLLDAGGPRNSIIMNAKAMGIDFKDYDKLILSHGHVDHYGGLINVLPKLKEGCELILTPNSYNQNTILVPKSGQEFYSPEVLTEKFRDLQKEKKFIYNIKLPSMNKSIIENLVNQNNLKIIEINKPIKLTSGITTSGEIEIFDEKELTKGFYLMKSRKEFEKNTFRDEISIYINVKDKGLVVITGCGHTGIVNTIKHGQKLTGINKIYALIGGFHKEWEKTEDIEESVRFIEGLNPEITCGMHCTGFEFNKIMSRHPSHTFGIVGTEFHL
ncbi:MAG: MBL fold metallo-hydrolase [Promethearchaeota archaeon]|nr:MAG: MBL fold metallo-hydrolase [Candidatus Lokiarchaeota archaeon]